MHYYFVVALNLDKIKSQERSIIKQQKVKIIEDSSNHGSPLKTKAYTYSLLRPFHWKSNKRPDEAMQAPISFDL